jgi:hypothetical protein
MSGATPLRPACMTSWRAQGLICFISNVPEGLVYR